MHAARWFSSNIPHGMIWTNLSLKRKVMLTCKKFLVIWRFKIYTIVLKTVDMVRLSISRLANNTSSLSGEVIYDCLRLLNVHLFLGEPVKVSKFFYVWSTDWLDNNSAGQWLKNGFVLYCPSLPSYFLVIFLPRKFCIIIKAWIPLKVVISSQLYKIIQ